MKRMKKALAFLLMMVMVMAMAVPAMAANDGTITINNAIKGENYTLYKVFDADPAAADATQNASKQIAYTYTGSGTFLTALQSTDSPFDVKEIATATNKYTITLKSGKTVSDVTTFLKNNVNNLEQIGSTVEAESTTVNFSNLAYGYYYISTTTGSTVTINSAAKSVTVEDKNTVPTVDKKQSTSASNYADTELDINIGDTVYYETTINGGKTNDKEITLTDTMSDSLDLVGNSVVVKRVESETTTTLTKDSDYTLTTSSHGFVLVLKTDLVKTLTSNSKVVVTYSATLNSSAAVDLSGTNREKNTVELKYSNQTSTDTVYVATYDALLKKVKESENGEFLLGAGFRLYDAVTGGNEIKVTAYGKTDSDAPNSYYVDKNKEGNGDEIIVNSGVGVSIKGLAPGKYYLEETTVPAGYQPLTARKEFVITNNATAAVEVKVVNNAGTALPSTGGIGTTLFYVIGAICVLGAGVLLVTRRRMASK